MNNYLDSLNEAQKQAVLQKDGPMIIIAGAGSGKTRVLTYRIAHLMNQGIDAFNILSLKFLIIFKVNIRKKQKQLEKGEFSLERLGSNLNPHIRK